MSSLVAFSLVAFSLQHKQKLITHMAQSERDNLQLKFTRMEISAASYARRLPIYKNNHDFVRVIELLLSASHKVVFQ